MFSKKKRYFFIFFLKKACGTEWELKKKFAKKTPLLTTLFFFHFFIFCQKCYGILTSIFFKTSKKHVLSTGFSKKTDQKNFFLKKNIRCTLKLWEKFHFFHHFSVVFFPKFFLALFLLFAKKCKKTCFFAKIDLILNTKKHTFLKYIFPCK